MPGTPQHLVTSPTPSSRLINTQLIHQLVEQGLKDSSDYTVSDYSRHRRLLQLLVEGCILRLSPDTLTPAATDQALYTLAILRQQCKSHPWIFRCRLDDEVSETPMYKWLIPRLLSAASRFLAQRVESALVEELCDTVLRLVLALGRDDRGGFTSARAERRVTRVTRQLLDYAEACITSEGQLFGCDLILPSPTVTIIIALVFLPATSAVPPRTQASFGRIWDSSTARHALSNGPHMLAHCVRTTAKVLRTGQWTPSLYSACKLIAASPLFSAIPDGIVSDFLSAVTEKVPPRLRFVIWDDLYVTVANLTPGKPPIAAVEQFLSNPIVGYLQEVDLTDKLEEQIALRRVQGVGRSEGPVTQAPENLLPSCRKRKRNLSVSSDVLDVIKTRLSPGGALSDARDLQEFLDLISRPTRVVATDLSEVLHAMNIMIKDPAHHSANGDDLHNIWLALHRRTHSHETWQLAIRVFRHTPLTTEKAEFREQIYEVALGGLGQGSCNNRLWAGRLFVELAKHLSDLQINERESIRSRLRAMLLRCLGMTSMSRRIVAIQIAGRVGRTASDALLEDMLEVLMRQLGASSSPLRSQAYAELVDLAEFHNKTPYSLFSPHLPRLSIILARDLATGSEMITETISFIGQNRQSFLQTTLPHILPALVLARDQRVLALIASILNIKLGKMLVDNMAGILTKVFLVPSETKRSLEFLMSIVSDRGVAGVSTMTLMTSCIVPFLVALIIELGSDDPRLSDNAIQALDNVQRCQQTRPLAKDDLGSFLRPHMLGVMTHLNETLHDIRGKMSVDLKRKLIRSLSVLIRLVGDSMASYSPQIMASLQSTLGIGELRLVTLRTWLCFIQTLKYTDVGPFVGRTTAAIVSFWPIMNAAEKSTSTAIVNEIVEAADHLVPNIDDIVDMTSIPELRRQGSVLARRRLAAPPREQLEKLLDRTASKNVAVATTSMKELRVFLRDRQMFVVQLAQGDVFDPLIGALMRNCLDAGTRDGIECEELRLVAFDNMGIIGALDPDRVAMSSETASITIMSNFADSDEAVEFALHLVREVLVDAFRGTTDTKLQGHLAYAIQSLLGFCGFTINIIHSSGPAVDLKTRQRWATLSKDQLETLTPLLESRFTLSDMPLRRYEHPIYPAAPTYREWLQMWTTNLLGRIQANSGEGPATTNSKKIFAVFRGVLRNEDVTIAHHILPHMVLNVLLNGNEVSREEIRQEINSVLEGQVSGQSLAGKRMYSAQVIFDLMDHLSRWLRLQRVASDSKTSRSQQVSIIDSVVSSIETELMANAALQSKAHARSLRSFEQRLLQLRTEKRAQVDLQTYYERLHEIYAELDEPDGMEGVSTFVISPSLEHQIREHESTGRWTAAQSCWEVRLQQSPDDVRLHEGLLRCLRNLGHYDTLRTHIRGVISRHPDWLSALSRYQAEAAWITNDWETVRMLGEAGPPVGRVLSSWQNGLDLAAPIRRARRQIGMGMTAKQYARVQDPTLQLHLLHEIEAINNASLAIQSQSNSSNGRAIAGKMVSDTLRSLDDRFRVATPTFEVQEQILAIRRTAFSLTTTQFREEVGSTWIQTSKIARKAGYEQTAYSAILQARELDTPFAFIQESKLLKNDGGAFKALTNLENAARPLLDVGSEKNDLGFARDRQLAKAVLLEARWARETDRFDANQILERFKKAIELAPSLESPYYRLGHYYDTIGDTNIEHIADYTFHTCHNYIMALQHGVKYIFQTMPRMLTLWLDLGEHKDIKRHAILQTNLHRITTIVDKSRKELPAYQFFTAFPQIISRIGHANVDVVNVLKKIMSLVIVSYPQQALWPTVGVMQSRRPERKSSLAAVVHRVQGNSNALVMVKEAERLSSTLLRLADHKVEDHMFDKKNKNALSLVKSFAYVNNAVPSRMIVPLQDALTCSLPMTANALKTHNPFASTPIEIRSIADRIDVMPSLQRPKKLIFRGTDGRDYPFLCKPHDDLRKDARLMDFNSMINKLLNRAADSRRRRLYIRTYAVMPLNEECGLLEWVANTNALKSILENEYAKQGQRLYTKDLHTLIEQTKRRSVSTQVTVFKDKILPMFSPTVFLQWFLITWPEPSAWLASRIAYARTLAVMSMIGYVLGLGDRHGENILFDGLTGDTVHVDFNCLFDKGKTFEIPERVPFRLTHNMVDALGVTGTEGVYRKAAEISMGILRANSNSLMSVLEAFAHDPLVEWSSRSGRNKSDKDIRVAAEKNLTPIRSKLLGIREEAMVATVPNQVDTLIKQATSPANLAVMYQGWAAWL